jgi:hypothetical protein
MIKDTGGAAFPGIHPASGLLESRFFSESGMQLRDYFAAKAMQSLLLEDGTAPAYFATRAREAYEIADAMLAERSKT